MLYQHRFVDKLIIVNDGSPDDSRPVIGRAIEGYAGPVRILCNLLDIGPMGAWTWNLTGDLWKFCVPFFFAFLWWVWADKSGLDKRREIERMEQRKRDRRQENLTALGLDTRARRKGGRK